MKKINSKISLAIASLAISSPAFAAAPTVTQKPYDNQTVATIINKIITWALGFAGAIAVLFIIYGGFLYMTASGNKDRQDAAKKTLTYAIIGLIVVILSQFIVAFVIRNVSTGNII